jgi:glutathione S-transferase
MFTLYGDAFWISPYFFTAFVALREKGLEHTVREVALHEKAQRRADFAAPSITGRVPALEHDGFWLAESSAIVEYLEDLHPTPALLPADARERARARQAMAWIRSDLMALREERPTTSMFYERTTKPLSEAGRAAADKLVRVADALVPEGRTTLFGAWSIADADLTFMLQRLLLNEEPVPAKLRAFAEAQWRRPSVRAFVERTRPPYQPY